jgi:hypothetical protein
MSAACYISVRYGCSRYFRFNVARVFIFGTFLMKAFYWKWHLFWTILSRRLTCFFARPILWSSLYNSVSIATEIYSCLRLDWTTGRSTFDPRQRQRICPLNLCVQTGSVAYPASCTMGIGGKARPGRDANHSPHLVPRSWMSRSYTSSPQNASIVCCGAALPLRLQ